MLFKACTPIELTHVAERMTKRQFIAGDVIIRQGEAGEEFFLISDGTSGSSVKGHDVASFRSRRFLRRRSVVTGEPRNATVVAKDDLVKYVLGKRTSAPLSKQAEAFATSFTGFISLSQLTGVLRARRDGRFRPTDRGPAYG